MSVEASSNPATRCPISARSTSPDMTVKLDINSQSCSPDRESVFKTSRSIEPSREST
jgi:hypothetical protein